MKLGNILSLAILATGIDSTKSFQIESRKSPLLSSENPIGNRIRDLSVDSRTALYSFQGETETTKPFWKNDLQINLPYALAYAGFMGFALLQSASEPAGASQAILDKFLANPVTPEGVNELFATEFNLLGLTAIPMACLAMPSAKRQPIPTVPFLIASSFAGYGGLGLWAMFQKPVTSVTKSELGWFTENVLENKLFNWFFLAVSLSVFYSTGSAQAFLDHPVQLWEGYTSLLSSSAIGSASTLDLIILSGTAASLIPQDLKRRGVEDSTRAQQIAVATLLFPIVGALVYCALRPPLLDTEQQ